MLQPNLFFYWFWLGIFFLSVTSDQDWPTSGQSVCCHIGSRLVHICLGPVHDQSACCHVKSRLVHICPGPAHIHSRLKFRHLLISHPNLRDWSAPLLSLNSNLRKTSLVEACNTACCGPGDPQPHCICIIGALCATTALHSSLWEHCTHYTALLYTLSNCSISI